LNSANNSRKRRALFGLLLAVAFLGAFFAGGLVHKYGIHQKTPAANDLITRATEEVQSAFSYPAPKQPTSEIFQKRDVEYPFTFIAYGDSREPAGWEKEALIRQIIKEKPSFVLHLGDMVYFGEEHQWKIFDLFEGRIIEEGIPFYPVLGNHEYHTRKEIWPSNPNPQLQHYFDRFEFLENRRWYSFKYNNSLFLILDTTTDHSPQSHQYEWLMNKLKAESPDFLVVALHYPLYTRDARGVRESEKLLAETFESYHDNGLAKADIVFSSHVHSYERYEHNGIQYVVSGGGGAPPVSIIRDPTDFFTKPGDAYHFCRVRVWETELTFEMVGLDEDTGKWVVADTFTISK